VSKNNSRIMIIGFSVVLILLVLIIFMLNDSKNEKSDNYQRDVKYLEELNYVKDCYRGSLEGREQSLSCKVLEYELMN